MGRINDPENFAGRVNYAAKVISEGRNSTRTFDSCFENDDGDEVAVALVRRAEKNPKLAANLYRYLHKETILEAAERLKGTDLKEEARASRARARVAFEKMMQEADARRSAQAQAAGA